MARARLPRPLARVLAAVLCLLLGLLLAEGSTRLLGLENRWLPDLAYYQGVDVEIHREARNSLLYELRPGVEVSLPVEMTEFVEEETSWWSDPRVIAINNLGHRGPDRELQKPEGVFRVLAFGGSNTFGAAVSNGETWPDALEHALIARGSRPVEVWNLGVNGYVTRQKLDQARAEIDRSDPDLLIFQIYNTGPRNLLLSDEVGVVETFRREPDLYGEVLLYSPQGQSPFLEWLWSASELYRSLVIVRNRRARVDAQGKYGAPNLVLDLRSEKDSEHRFRDFLAVARARGIPVLLLYGAEGPGPEWCERAGVPVIRLAEEAQIPDLPGARHIHPGAAVYTWYGERIAERLLSAGCLEGPCDFGPVSARQ